MVGEGPKGKRTVKADDCFKGLLTTALGRGRDPDRDPHAGDGGQSGAAYMKFPHPASRFAVVGVAAVLTRRRRQLHEGQRGRHRRGHQGGARQGRRGGASPARRSTPPRSRRPPRRRPRASMSRPTCRARSSTRRTCAACSRGGRSRPRSSGRRARRASVNRRRWCGKGPSLNEAFALGPFPHHRRLCVAPYARPRAVASIAREANIV